MTTADNPQITSLEALTNRLRRVSRMRRKWAKRLNLTSFRLYERDLPDHPLIIDRYGDYAVVWAFERTRDRDHPQARHNWLAALPACVATGCGIPSKQVVIKERRK
jgi:23S rRNA G2069 N7-methylase RlmK/C1962 C5-methylase RlmI